MLKLIRITTVPISLKVLLKGQLKFMSNYFEVIGVSSPGKELLEVQANEGIHTYSIKMTRRITPFQDILAIIRLFFYFLKTKPEIVHTHTPKAGLLGMIAAKMAFVPKRFHTVAGMPLMETTGSKRKLLEIVEKITYACATKVYPNSIGLWSFIFDNDLCKKQKMKVIGNGSSNGIDTEYFSTTKVALESVNKVRRDLGFQKEDFVFLFVGRIVKEKGVDELIAAFISIKRPNMKLLMVGDFEEDLDPISSISKIEIFENPNISFVGYKEDVRPYFTVSNVLVFPSYREGFPNVVMQAGAMGLPCIVSNINGCNEIIKNETNGLTIPLKDKTQLVESMEKLISNIELYYFMRDNSREMIVDRYDCKNMWNMILEEYNS